MNISQTILFQNVINKINTDETIEFPKFDNFSFVYSLNDYLFTAEMGIPKNYKITFQKSVESVINKLIPYSKNKFDGSTLEFIQQLELICSNMATDNYNDIEAVKNVHIINSPDLTFKYYFFKPEDEITVVGLI